MCYVKALPVLRYLCKVFSIFHRKHPGLQGSSPQWLAVIPLLKPPVLQLGLQPSVESAQMRMLFLFTVTGHSLTSGEEFSEKICHLCSYCM